MGRLSLGPIHDEQRASRESGIFSSPAGRKPNSMFACAGASLHVCVCVVYSAVFSHPVNPFQARDQTGVDLFLQPRPHAHPLHRHGGLQTWKE